MSGKGSNRRPREIRGKVINVDQPGEAMQTAMTTIERVAKSGPKTEGEHKLAMALQEMHRENVRLGLVREDEQR